LFKLVTTASDNSWTFDDITFNVEIDAVALEPVVEVEEAVEEEIDTTIAEEYY